VIKNSGQPNNEMTWFSDTPERKTGKITQNYFAEKFKLLFVKSRPNATLMWKEAGDSFATSAVFTIQKAKFKSTENKQSIALHQLASNFSSLSVFHN